MTTETLTKEQLLRDALPLLNARDQEFASSLLNQLARRGSLSDRQWPWVDKLIERAQPKPAPKADIVNLTKLTELFNRAADQLKNPKVAFSCSAGDFVVTRAKDNSRNPGFLYLKDVSGEYLGKVSPTGELFVTQYHSEGQQVIFEALDGFAQDPASAAAAYGKATSHCCFCSKFLEDPRSVEVGYGPVCASRWGLPWGE